MVQGKKDRLSTARVEHFKYRLLSRILPRCAAVWGSATPLLSRSDSLRQRLAGHCRPSSTRALRWRLIESPPVPAPGIGKTDPSASFGRPNSPDVVADGVLRAYDRRWRRAAPLPRAARWTLSWCLPRGRGSLPLRPSSRGHSEYEAPDFSARRLCSRRQCSSRA
jgi:hypothetical protein